MHKRIGEGTSLVRLSFLLSSNRPSDLETMRIHTAVTIRAIWGRASTAEGSVNKKDESLQDQDESLPALSSEQGFQTMTMFNSKASWTTFNKNLMATMMTSDVKGLQEVPGFDPIEE